MYVSPITSNTIPQIAIANIDPEELIQLKTIRTIPAIKDMMPSAISNFFIVFAILFFVYGYTRGFKIWRSCSYFNRRVAAVGADDQ